MQITHPSAPSKIEGVFMREYHILNGDAVMARYLSARRARAFPSVRVVFRRMFRVAIWTLVRCVEADERPPARGTARALRADLEAFVATARLPLYPHSPCPDVRPLG